LEIFRFNEEEENSDLDNDEDNHPPPEGNNDPELTVDNDLTLADLEGVEPEDPKDNYTSDSCCQSLAKVSFFIYQTIYSSIFQPTLMHNQNSCINFWQFRRIAMKL
jgi:hypothetical protein